VRTNQYFYATNNIDLIRHVQIIGSTQRTNSSDWFNTAHRVLTNYNALNEKTVFTYNSKQQLTSIKTPDTMHTIGVRSRHSTFDAMVCTG
jgi:hypothetical protein